MENHLIRVDNESKGIMNLDPISDLRKTNALNVEIGMSDEQAKFGFSPSYCNSSQSQIQKIISYSILIGIILLLCSN